MTCVEIVQRPRTAVELEIGDAQGWVMPGRMVLGRRGELRMRQDRGLERPVEGLERGIARRHGDGVGPHETLEVDELFRLVPLAGFGQQQRLERQGFDASGHGREPCLGGRQGLAGIAGRDQRRDEIVVDAARPSTMAQRLAVAVDRRRRLAALVQGDGKGRPGLRAVRRHGGGGPVCRDRIAMTSEALEKVSFRNGKLGAFGEAGADPCAAFPRHCRRRAQPNNVRPV